MHAFVLGSIVSRSSFAGPIASWHKEECILMALVAINFPKNRSCSALQILKKTQDLHLLQRLCCKVLAKCYSLLLEVKICQFEHKSSKQKPDAKINGSSISELDKLDSFFRCVLYWVVCSRPVHCPLMPNASRQMFWFHSLEALFQYTIKAVWT